ncbi:hypothetical protein STEG23_002082 [Scotinomys teguina]
MLIWKKGNGKEVTSTQANSDMIVIYPTLENKNWYLIKTFRPNILIPNYLSVRPRTLTFKMKTATLLIIIFLLQLMIPVNAEETFDSLLEKKIKKILSEGKCPSTVSCTSVTTKGRLASCPAGMSVTGCACGYGCGSWDIRNENTCHCQCSVMDWTTARCCKLA